MKFRNSNGYYIFIFLFTITFIVVGIININNYNKIIQDKSEEAHGYSKNTVILFKWLTLGLVILCVIILFFNLFSFSFGIGFFEWMSPKSSFLSKKVEGIDVADYLYRAGSPVAEKLGNFGSAVGGYAARAGKAAGSGLYKAGGYAASAGKAAYNYTAENLGEAYDYTADAARAAGSYAAGAARKFAEYTRDENGYYPGGPTSPTPGGHERASNIINSLNLPENDKIPRYLDNRLIEINNIIPDMTQQAVDAEGNVIPDEVESVVNPIKARIKRKIILNNNCKNNPDICIPWLGTSPLDKNKGLCKNLNKITGITALTPQQLSQCDNISS